MTHNELRTVVTSLVPNGAHISRAPSGWVEAGLTPAQR